MIGKSCIARFTHSTLCRVGLYGYWFAPERLALQAFVTESQKNVTAWSASSSTKGTSWCWPQVPVSLYHPAIATMEADPTRAFQPG